MKKGLLTVFLLLIFGGLPAPDAQAADNKIAYVDIAKVFNEYQRTKDNEQKLQDAGRKKEEERDAIVHEIRQLKDEIVLLANDAKEKKQEILDGKIRELQDFDRDVKRDLGQDRNKAVREIFADIDEVVKAYGQRKGYDLILNERALLYHDDKFDITNEIIKEVNKSYKD